MCLWTGFGSSTFQIKLSILFGFFTIIASPQTLDYRGINIFPHYHLFHDHIEDMNHLFFFCPYATQLWYKLILHYRGSIDLNIYLFDPPNWDGTWTLLKDANFDTTVDWDTLLPFCILTICKSRNNNCYRNNNVFDNKSTPPSCEASSSEMVEFFQL